MAFSIIREDFGELRLWLSNWIFFRRHSIKLNLAIRMADMKQKAFNRRYFVVLIEMSKGEKLVSLNNTEFKRMKRIKWLPKGMSTLELEEKAFYQTPISRNNKSTKEERKIAKDKYMKYARRYMK